MLNISLAKPFKTNSMPFPCARKTDIQQLVQVVGSDHGYKPSIVTTNMLHLSVSGSACPGHCIEGNAGSQEMYMKKAWLKIPAPLHFYRNFKHAKLLYREQTSANSHWHQMEFILHHGLRKAKKNTTTWFDIQQHDACRGQLCRLWTNAPWVLQSSFATSSRAAMIHCERSAENWLKSVVSAVPWPPMRNHHEKDL